MRKLLAVAMFALASISAAQAMTVSQFLAKANDLKAKGVLALASPDMSLLRNEVKAASTAYREDINAATKAGRTSHSCPPPQGKAAVSSDDVIKYFQAMPEADKPKTSVKTAFYALMKTRYPCR